MKTSIKERRNMNKDLQDKAWSSFPQEFKEEVRSRYKKLRKDYDE